MSSYKRDIKLSKYQDEIMALAVLNGGIIKPDEDLFVLHTGNSERRVNRRTINALLDIDILEEQHDGSFIFDEAVYNFYMNQKIHKEVKPFFYEGVLIEPLDAKLRKFAEANEEFPFINWDYRKFLDETSLNGCSLYDVFIIDNKYYRPTEYGCFRLLEI